MVSAVSCMHPAARQTWAEQPAATPVAAAPFRRHRAQPRQRRPQLLARVPAVSQSVDSSGEVTMEDRDDEDLEAKMEEFLRLQAERESGESFVAPAAAVAEEPLGVTEVSDDDAKALCREVSRMLKLLKSNRDMSVNEVKLTLAIEDPRARERRESMGIEDTSGVSRDELAAALMEVSEGRIPKDRIALRELTREMLEWPYADISGDSRTAQMASTVEEDAAAGAGPVGGDGVAPPAPDGASALQGRRPPKLLGRDKNEKPTSVADLLPDWVGYSFLYALSVTPVIIFGSVIAILFFNSLK